VALVLVFLPVLIIVGVGSLAWWLAASVIHVNRVARKDAVNGGQVIEYTSVQAPKTKVPTSAGHVDRYDDKPRNESGSGAKANVVKLLNQNGGKVHGGQRGLAALIGASRTRFQQVLKELVEEGRVFVSIDRLKGTTLQLA